MSEDLIKRWDAFLSRIKDRFNEILAQTDEPLKDVIDNLQYDNVMIHNIKTGLYNQTVIQLNRKVEEGWEKMQTQIDKSGNYDLIDSQSKKLNDIMQWMEDEFTRFEINLFAKAAEKILDNVKRHIDESKMHRCTQCAGELPIKIYSFMAVNIKCESCGSVNTYQPDDRIRALEYYVINPLAEKYAMEEKINGRKDKNAQKEYYKKFYTYLMDNVPDKKDFYKRAMDERLNNPHFE